MPRHGHLGEFELIESLLAPLTLAAPGAFGLTDDAALITPRDGKELVVTTDAMVAGVHFLPDDPPGDIGRKLLRVSLSDLAGMGAAPEAYLLTLALTGDTPRAWIEAFVAGLADDQARFGVHLIGGDTVSSPGVITVSLTAMGWVQRGQALRRAGVETATFGAHVLRHSAATEWLRQGASLQLIGEMLRHGCVESTTHYAKVDTQLLQQVARPWPGVSSC